MSHGEHEKSAQTEHTPEPWRTDAKSGFPQDVHDATGNLVAACSEANFGDANARRIVACVNACAGIQTERIESFCGKLAITSFISMWKSYCEKKMQLEDAIEQRDELLEALEDLAVRASRAGVNTRMADAAIASVKGLP